MDKLLLFPGASEKGVFTFLIDNERDHLVKTAAEYHPTIAAYINSAKKIPGKTQILLTALGASEWWGPNRNFDAFPEAALAHEGDDYGYKTFEKNAHVFRHHINKIERGDQAYGVVALAVYNPIYHRVELIVSLDNSTAGDIVARIENGDYPEWSMGTKVPFDVCSICGNKAPTRKQYCHHLKYYLGKIEPESGRLAYAINTKPNFFDISQVLIGADRTAKTLKKVASYQYPVISSALLAEKMAEKKEATIEKEVPASNEPPASQQELVDGIAEVKSREPALPRPVLNRLGEAGLPRALSTLTMMGIIPKPQEFQRIILISIKRPDIADKLDDAGISFDPMMRPDPTPDDMQRLDLSAGHFDPGIFDMVRPYMADRSYAAPLLGKRLSIMIEKQAEVQKLPRFVKVAADDDRKPVGIIPLLTVAAGLYAALARKAAPEAVGKIDGLIARHPGLAAALGVGAYMVHKQMFGAGMKGQTQLPEGDPDTNDLASRVEQLRSKPFLKVGAAIGPAAKQVFLGVPAAYMASGIAQKHHEASPQDQQRRIFHFIRQYPDVISAGLTLSALADLHGKGVYSHLHGAKEFAKTHLGKIKSMVEKSASAGDFVSGALIWPLAFGGAGLPGRVAGGLFDQAAFEASKKLLSDRNKPSTIKTRRS